MYIPEFNNKINLERGRAEFQHPNREYIKFDEKIDRFSFWVILCALEALKFNKEFWKESTQGGYNSLDNLLFTSADFKNFSTSKLVNNLYSLNIDYAAINNKLGLKNKYRYDLFNIKNNKLINNIIQDSREQNPLQFNNCKVKVEKLDVGDYSYNNAKISIERKSLLDLLGTLSKGYERFCNEIVRAENANIKLVIVVENPISELLSFFILIK